MSRYYCGCCKSCGKWSDAPNNFDERKHYLICPECSNACSLNRGPVVQKVKELRLSPSTELTGEIARLATHSRP